MDRSTQDMQLSMRCRRLGASQPFGFLRLSNRGDRSRRSALRRRRRKPLRAVRASLILATAVLALDKVRDRCRVIRTLVADEGDAGLLAPGADLDVDRLCLAEDTILDGDRERTKLVHGRPAALEQQARPLLASRHQRLLACPQRKLPTSVLRRGHYWPCDAPKGASPPDNVAARRLSRTRFVPRRGVSAVLPSRGQGSRKHPDVGRKPVCNVATGRSLRPSLV